MEKPRITHVDGVGKSKRGFQYSASLRKLNSQMPISSYQEDTIPYAGIAIGVIAAAAVGLGCLIADVLSSGKSR